MEDLQITLPTYSPIPYHSSDALPDLLVLTVDRRSFQSLTVQALPNKEITMCLLNVSQMKSRAGKAVFLIGLALATSACTTKVEQWDYPEFLGINPNIAPDPPCNTTGAGYFTSNTPQKYFRCVYDSNDSRWLKYHFTCPGVQNFNQTTQKCQ
jgi:hypothetical protein